MVYDLIASHGDIENLIFFAVLMKDYERVISHHLRHEQYSLALDVLSKQVSHQSSPAAQYSLALDVLSKQVNSRTNRLSCVMVNDR